MSNASRGGSYLVSQILSTHPMVTVASEPFLELFRSFRNVIFTMIKSYLRSILKTI